MVQGTFNICLSFLSIPARSRLTELTSVQLQPEFKEQLNLPHHEVETRAGGETWPGSCDRTVEVSWTHWEETGDGDELPAQHERQHRLQPESRQGGEHRPDHGADVGPVVRVHGLLPLTI